MFKHILVPLDGSPRAEQALSIAARIARFTGGSLLLVQVVSSPLDYDGGLALIPLANQQVIDEEMSSATLYLQSLATSPELAGIKVRMEVLLGLPVQHLLAFAATSGIDLIVLCSHGRTGFTRWVLGSVAHALVHQCSLPILVLRQSEASSSLAAGPLRTLVPLDGSPLAEVALRPAACLTAALAVGDQGLLHLTQVVKSSPTLPEGEFISELEGFAGEQNEAASQHAGTYLRQIEERLSPEMENLHLSLTYSVDLAPDIASTLLTLAEHGKAGETRENVPYDLIAISTHGRGGLERWVMGSITDRLLNTTKLPMLIVRPSK